jgi:hypothetical protein
VRQPDFKVGDPITWKDLDGDAPEVRVGVVVAELSAQYLVQPPTGCERFVFKNDATLSLYKENNE